VRSGREEEEWLVPGAPTSPSARLMQSQRGSRERRSIVTPFAADEDVSLPGANGDVGVPGGRRKCRVISDQRKSGRDEIRAFDLL
jgi:hypothetical protein